MSLGYGVGYPTARAVAVWRVGAARPSVVAASRGDAFRNVDLAPAPDGRLWAIWRADDQIRVARSNRTVTAWGAP